MPEDNLTKSPFSSRPSYEVLQPLIISVALMIGMIVGFKLQSNNSPNSYISKLDNGEQYGVGRVEEIIRYIESKYVDELDSESLVENAIKTVMKELDPHSVYIPKEHLVTVNNQLKGSYEGIGIETIYHNDTLVIMDVLANGPADMAGVKLFDKIINVAGNTKISGEYDPAVIRELLKGEIGTKQSLVVRRHDTQAIDTLTMTVGNVQIKSADIAYMVDDSVGYIKIERFNAQIYKEFMESVERLYTDHQMKHLIIDVRQNPGGYLPETTKILSQLFPEKDKLLVYTEGKNDEKLEYHTSGKVFFDTDKIAVLIDEASASGSEIIAGAIQDWDRGVIVGRRSYGKGLVQEQYMLSSGDAVRLTVARYYTPSGRSIQKDFNDDDAYSDELSDRSLSGELTDASKMPVKDTTQYYTKLHRRVVFGGGGIIPDVFIPINQRVNEKAIEELKSIIPEFIYAKVQILSDQFPSDYKSYIQSDFSNQSFAESFLTYLLQEDYLSEEQVSTDYHPILDKWIHAGVVKTLYGKISEYQYLNKDDLFISEAMHSFHENKSLVELSEEN